MNSHGTVLWWIDTRANGHWGRKILVLIWLNLGLIYEHTRTEGVKMLTLIADSRRHPWNYQQFITCSSSLRASLFNTLMPAQHSRNLAHFFRFHFDKMFPFSFQFHWILFVWFSWQLQNCSNSVYVLSWSFLKNVFFVIQISLHFVC